MSDTWIIDLRHYLAPTGAMAALPKPAQALADYFASIVVDATTNLDEDPSIRCRRRPGRRRCPGIVMSYPTADLTETTDAIAWFCPICRDNGLIRGWQRTLWDGFSDPPRAEAQ